MKPRELWRVLVEGDVLVVRGVQGDGVLVEDFGGASDGVVDVWSREDFVRCCVRVEGLA